MNFKIYLWGVYYSAEHIQEYIVVYSSNKTKCIEMYDSREVMMGRVVRTDHSANI